MIFRIPRLFTATFPKFHFHFQHQSYLSDRWRRRRPFRDVICLPVCVWLCMTSTHIATPDVIFSVGLILVSVVGYLRNVCLSMFTLRQYVNLFPYNLILKSVQ